MLTDPRKKKGVMASNGEILRNPTKKQGVMASNLMDVKNIQKLDLEA
jgi:hypothetical protein